MSVWAYVGIYLGVGAVLVAQGTIRGWRYWRPTGLDDIGLLVGGTWIWPVILASELLEWRRIHRKATEKRST